MVPIYIVSRRKSLSRTGMSKYPILFAYNQGDYRDFIENEMENVDNNKILDIYELLLYYYYTQ